MFDQVIAINLKAPFFLIQRAISRLRDGGRIINISSGVARSAVPDMIPYAMSKEALNTMTLQLAKELGPRNITVNSLSPGVTDTDMNAGWLRGNPEAQKTVASMSVFGRTGQPEDVADIAAFLAGSESRWITGQVIDASGGALRGVTT